METSDMTTPTIQPSPDGIISALSPFDIPQTLTRLRQVIAAHGLTELAHVDHSGEARRVGLEMPETHVLLFGSPRGGTQLMVARPLIALDLPLKTLIWQDADGHVRVSYESDAYVSRRFDVPSGLDAPLASVAIIVDEALRQGQPSSGK